MARIRIKNFGPIRQGRLDNDGWLDIKNVSVFIGNQGSGKSCVAKLISTFMWIEKALVRSDYAIADFSAEKFRGTYCGYHRIERYFYNKQNEDTAELEYEGEAYSMKYSKGNFEITKGPMQGYHLPQIMYVPAERNFISIIKEAKSLKALPDSLLEYLTEFNNAKDAIKGYLSLPINEANIEYDKLGDVINVSGKDYTVELSEASSGFQSLVPLFLVSWYLVNRVKGQVENPQKMSQNELQRFNEGVKSIWADKSLTDEQRRTALSALSAQFNKTAFINIVEEPEQNLFPSSQWKIIQSLLAFNNSLEANKLIITTHSPYLINVLTIAVKAGMLKEKAASNSDVLEQINAVYPIDSSMNPTDIAIYELDEGDGSISLLKTYQGLPSDDNFVNNMLEEANETFAELLEIQQTL